MMREKLEAQPVGGLLSCPFCGVTPTLGVLSRGGGFSPKDGGDVVHHGDDECPADGFHILKVWNRRASPPRLDVDSDVDSLGDLPSSWPTNEEESASPPPAEPRGKAGALREAAEKAVAIIMEAAEAMEDRLGSSDGVKELIAAATNLTKALSATPEPSDGVRE